ncbi:4349_t:CDS:2 [Acaulospora morrowiae]|uniref:4349_t:CDS:1 n=1 Tax=Acaulospora morrowiae TaxID=94023 RepID=A0A9N8Z729_9GLOM|nr:4349_t:CDS:2 [Acaulospora morrowiae]
MNDVCLKSIENSGDPIKFLREIKTQQRLNNNNFFIKVLGITKPSNSLNYMVVTQLAGEGSLREYLDRKYSELSWRDKLNILWRISYGLKFIHSRKLIHKGLHSGNVLIGGGDISYIGDFGLSERINYGTPSLILDLMKRCWSAEPRDRPTALELFNTLHEWWMCLDEGYNESHEMFKQIREIEESNKDLNKSKPLKYVTHPQAIYISRFFDFPSAFHR